jgi:hypothetical protein
MRDAPYSEFRHEGDRIPICSLPAARYGLAKLEQPQAFAQLEEMRHDSAMLLTTRGDPDGS